MAPGAFRRTTLRRLAMDVEVPPESSSTPSSSNGSDLPLKIWIQRKHCDGRNNSETFDDYGCFILTHDELLAEDAFLTIASCLHYMEIDEGNLFEVAKRIHDFYRGQVDCISQCGLDNVETAVEVQVFEEVWIYDEMEVIEMSMAEDIEFTPASKLAIEGLEKVEIAKVEALKGERKGGCVICLEDFSDEEEEGRGTSKSLVMVTKMPCSHVFHSHCIVKWLEKNHVCPLCRFEMPKEY